MFMSIHGYDDPFLFFMLTRTDIHSCGIMIHMYIDYNDSYVFCLTCACICMSIRVYLSWLWEATLRHSKIDVILLEVKWCIWSWHREPMLHYGKKQQLNMLYELMDVFEKLCSITQGSQLICYLWLDVKSHLLSSHRCPINHSSAE